MILIEIIHDIPSRVARIVHVHCSIKVFPHRQSLSVVEIDGSRAVNGLHETER